MGFPGLDADAFEPTERQRRQSARRFTHGYVAGHAESSAAANRGRPIAFWESNACGGGPWRLGTYSPTPDGLTTGYIRVDAPAKMYTFDANLRAEGPSVLSDRVDYLLGFRYLNLKDSVSIDSGATINSAVKRAPATDMATAPA